MSTTPCPNILKLSASQPETFGASKMNVDEGKTPGLCSNDRFMSMVNKTLKGRPSKHRRLPNAFMLFVKDYRGQMTKKYPKESKAMISSLLGRQWKTLDPATRKKYFDMYEAMKAENLENYSVENHNFKENAPDENFTAPEISPRKEKRAAVLRLSFYKTKNYIKTRGKKLLGKTSKRPAVQGDENVENILENENGERKEETEQDMEQNQELPPNLKELILKPKNDKICRPPNAFMLFAREHRKKLVEENPSVTNRYISTLLGKMWGSLDKETKMKYFAEAKKLDMLHKETYPGYTYNPGEARLRKQNREEMRWKINHPEHLSYTSKGSSEAAISPGYNYCEMAGSGNEQKRESEDVPNGSTSNDMTHTSRNFDGNSFNATGNIPPAPILYQPSYYRCPPFAFPRESHCSCCQRGCNSSEGYLNDAKALSFGVNSPCVPIRPPFLAMPASFFNRIWGPNFYTQSDFYYPNSRPLQGNVYDYSTHLQGPYFNPESTMSYSQNCGQLEKTENPTSIQQPAELSSWNAQTQIGCSQNYGQVDMTEKAPFMPKLTESCSLSTEPAASSSKTCDHREKIEKALNQQKTAEDSDSDTPSLIIVDDDTDDLYDTALIRTASVNQGNETASRSNSQK